MGRRRDVVINCPDGRCLPLNKAESSIDQCRVVAVLRGLPRAEILAVAGALVDGGVTCIEVTMTSPGAFESIMALVEEMPGVLTGAGTVLTPDEVRRAVESGAEYIISPNTNVDVIRETKRYGRLSVPGAMTPTEIVTAMSAGADIVKVFPASVVGPRFFREMRGPLPRVRLMATGGVSVDDAGEFIKAGAYAVALGTSLVPKDLVQQKKYDQITDRARTLVRNVRISLG